MSKEKEEYPWWGWLILIIIIFTIINGFSDTSRESNESTRQSTPHTYYESRGYECTDDCSGHDAGYEWAADNDVCDEDYSESNSNSFDEGVRAYAEDNC